MERTNIFVSYSHLDDGWNNRLQMHLAVLKRKGLVDVWSDSNINIGQQWQQEIETALTRASVAILLVSPGFLASDYIWREEMPRIVRHAESGMKVLPLIVRPCAWRLADELSGLQARPIGATALSTKTEAQIDLNLADFVMELATMVRALPAKMFNDRTELPLNLELTPASVGDAISDVVALVDQFPRVWQGTYAASSLVLTLEIRWTAGAFFTGTLTYDKGDALSEIAGRVGPSARLFTADDGWDMVRERIEHGYLAVRPGEPQQESADIGIEFARVSVLSGDHHHLQHTTDYRGFVFNRTILGGWFCRGNSARSIADTIFTATP